MNYLRLLRAVSRPEIDTREFEGLMKEQASVCYCDI